MNCQAKVFRKTLKRFPRIKSWILKMLLKIYQKNRKK